MNGAEKSALWRRRLFEAESGLTRYLIDRHGDADPAAWFRVRSEIFAELPPPGDEEPQAWQRVFFRAQALMERFLVSRYGHGELRNWAAANADVHRSVEPDTDLGAFGPVLRIARQAELYGSRYELPVRGPARAVVEIEHCAIWDYRERARARSVPITLRSPCEYCTYSMAANVAAKGYVSSFELAERPDGHGCRWEARVSTADADEVRALTTEGDGGCAE